MKSVVVKFTKQVELTVVVPDTTKVEDIERVALDISDDLWFEETVGADEMPWEVSIGHGEIVDVLPDVTSKVSDPDSEEEQVEVLVLSDDGEDFVPQREAEWWKTAR